ncbi:MAG: lysostaphin resistance A-like protein [Bdellovibrionales bacterium]
MSRKAWPKVFASLQAICLGVAVSLASPALAEWLESRPVKDPDRPRNEIWMPLAGFVLPGFPQYFERQWTSAATYTAVGVTGLGLGIAATNQVDTSKAQNDEVDEQDGPYRQYTYGLQLYMFAGEISAYHSFRTAAASRRSVGQYTFLPVEENPKDLLLAPFEVEHLLRPTTYIPFLILLGVGISELHSGASLNIDDVAFTGGVSYNAGVGEEAFFRGYMMPLFRERWDSPFWANFTSSVFFGAAHYSESNRFPVAQALIGYYLGWMTQRNDWSLRQSIFWHTWWDVIAIGLQVADKNARAVRPIPLFTVAF